MHAWTAWPFTAAIDYFAYGEAHMRRLVAEEVVRRIMTDGERAVHTRQRRRRRRRPRVVDVGCGAGTLTYELARTDMLHVVGVDTSHEMIGVARALVRHPHVRFQVCNGADVACEYDAAIVCMVMHELPAEANAYLLSHLQRVCSEVWVVDIVPTYAPSPSMLSGEPYLLEYLQTIESIVGVCSKRYDVVPGHVRAWIVRNATVEL